jgi:PKD repeat protein
MSCGAPQPHRSRLLDARIAASLTLIAALLVGMAMSPPVRAQSLAVSAGGPYTSSPGLPIVMSGSLSAFGIAAFQWTWSFGDGTTAVGQTVQKVYTAPGTYTVILQVQTSQGLLSATTTATVVGQGGVGQLSAGGPYRGVVGQPIVMTATTGVIGAPVLQWTWSFGDGTAASGQTVQKAYAAAGTYTVTVQLQTAQGTFTASTTAFVTNQATSTQISAGGPYTGTVGQPITMSGSVLAVGLAPSQWTWIFGDGTSAIGQTVQKTYTTPGTYTVTLQVSQVGLVGSFTATTTATITGGATTTPAVPTTTVSLVAGCNNVIATWPDGTLPSTVVTAVTPAGVAVALWRQEPGTQVFVGYAPGAAAVSDLRTVNRFDALFICTIGPATLARPAVP